MSIAGRGKAKCHTNRTVFNDIAKELARMESSHYITIDAVNEFVKLFPASHSFASLPCSLSVILTQINRVVKEQSKLENLLQVLTSGQEGHDYSSVFGMDVILIKQQLKPVPIPAGEEE